jgi:thiol-disulfide isomerase/thioredoxin
MAVRSAAAVAVSLLLVAASAGHAATLTVGDAAPPLTVGKWVKGEPVASIEKGKIYVVEFWATWCGPCRATIPHVSELSKKYPDVTFIGQNVWENDVSQVEPFVKQMGDQMSYRVATDAVAEGGAPDTGKMAQNWMKAADQDGIPTAFIVGKDGKIAWIGHPVAMDKPLAQVIDGTFDLAAAKKEAEQAAKGREEQKAVAEEFRAKVAPKAQAQDYEGAAAAIDELVAQHPAMKANLMSAKLSLLLQAKQFDGAYKAADALAEARNDDPQVQNGLAWAIVDQPPFEGHRDLDRALKFATRAVALTNEKEPAPLDTLARVYADKGDNAKAIELQTKAVTLAEGELKAEMQKTLEKYQAKAK